MARDRNRRGEEFARRFEGGDVLQGLLELAGCPLDVGAVVERMRQGVAAGESAGTVLPTLFEREPHFPSPDLARRLFQNLLGLWDLVEAGRPVELKPREKAPRPKKPRPVPPTPFAPGEPGPEYVEHAWRYLEDLDDRGFERLNHSFENRQDALLGFLDEQGLSDDGYGVARHLLFELHAMLELGWPKGLRSVTLAELQGGQDDAGVPAALGAYADEALFEAEQDEDAPLSPEESAKVRDAVQRGLSALWSAREA